MFMFTATESHVIYSVTGDKYKTELVSLANVCGLFLVLDVNDIIILHNGNTILNYLSVIEKDEWQILLCTKTTFPCFNKL
jgi:hypothetical protein